MHRSSALIPDGLRRTVLAWFGPKGQAWLEALPATIDRLAEEWRVSIGEPFTGGSAAIVLAVSRDGMPAVLKVAMPHDENRTEADALRHYDGKGAVRLYEYDPPSGALLLERLTPGISLVAHPDSDETLDIACAVIRRLWRPPVAGHPFALVRDLTKGWADALPAWQERHGRPFPDRLVDRAAALARELAGLAGASVVVNRDSHAGNILSAEREPWLLIDPKPLVGDRSFDAGYLLLDRLGDLPTAAKADVLVDRLASRLGVEETRVRAWALLRAVENALWALDIGASPAADLAKAIALHG